MAGGKASAEESQEALPVVLQESTTNSSSARPLPRRKWPDCASGTTQVA